MSNSSLDQQRAANAIKRIREIEADGTVASKYVGYVKALPASILANGLGQALATELAAKDSAHDKLAEHVACWLLTAPASQYAQDSQQSDHAKTLLNRIVTGDQRAYVWAQAEAIAYVGWLKKLAVAFLTKDGQPGGARADAGR